MSQQWNVLLREKVNETNFILAKYQNYNSKDQWNCICSSMDWIDVGMTNICKALDELKNSDGLETCMKFYQYICCIDMVWGGICQLHRVFINRDTIPFDNDSSVFQMKYFEEDDNRYFEEIRSCFGAHPVELKTKQTSKKQEAIRKFASWSTHYGTPQEMSVLIYSNIPKSRFEEVVVTVEELKSFYEKRCIYIKQIIDAIENIAHDYKEEMKNSVIPKSNNLTEQITILKNASQQRFGGGILVEELEQIERFLMTNFSCIKNKDAVETFRQKVVLGIVEIYDYFQNMNVDCNLEIEKLLLPQYMPHENHFRYEFANLYSKAILKIWKTYDANSIKVLLEKYICFEYKTDEELYWLTVIALNLAQDDLKKST
ncbi:MAG: hypothetical protein IKJ59_04885 [Clostridia bacterium]|nr:hypothetical protein [Clostridia bacterium]